MSKNTKVILGAAVLAVLTSASFLMAHNGLTSKLFGPKEPPDGYMYACHKWDTKEQLACSKNPAGINDKNAKEYLCYGIYSLVAQRPEQGITPTAPDSVCISFDEPPDYYYDETGKYIE